MNEADRNNAYEAFTEVKEECERLRAQLSAQATTLAVMREALISIASQHKPEQIRTSYWVNLGIEATARVVANDTRIARRALARLDALVGGGKPMPVKPETKERK